MSNYAQLSSRLGVARRAYKRAGVMAGLVVFLIEALGIAAIAIAADVLFDLGTGGRIALLILGAAALVYFAVRHILKPLGQKITDQQMALYLEQRNPEFEGSLIAATEFGPQSYTGRVAQIVDSILDQAVDRVGRFDLKRAIDLSRLRKYGVVAMVLLGVYVIAAVTMPDRVSRRFARVFTPWKPLPQEVDPNQPPRQPELPPIELTLASGDTSLVRGGTLQLQASTSRTPQGNVAFHFRSLSAGGEWKMLNMTETDKLHAYQLTLPDINEDLEFFVSVENARTAPNRVTVFDPLLIKSYEVVTKYPSYLRFPDRIDTPATPDIAAVAGSTVTIRTIANGPVASGTLAWDGKEPQPGTADGESLTASFEVTANGSFHIQLTDKYGQKAETPAPALVTALPDRAPAVKLTSPLQTVNAHPLCEVPFFADVSDDLALDSADLVVTRTLEPDAQPIRIPIKLEGTPEPTGGLTAARAAVVLALEDLQPAIKVGDILSCYIEVRDRKGQVGLGDLTTVLVGSFESWAYYSPEVHAGGPMREQYDLEPVVVAAWRIHRSKQDLAPNDFNRQLEELAATMVDSAGNLHPYFDPEEKTPEQIKHGEAGMKLAKLGYEELRKHDSDKAVNLLRAALAELLAAGMGNTEVVMPPPPASAQANASMKSEISKLATQVQQQQAPPPPGQRTEQDKAAADADALARAEELEKAQTKVADQMSKTAQAPDNQAKNDANAREQESVAAKAEAAAKDINAKAADDPNRKEAAADLANAARTMKAAADAAKAGRKEEAARKAEAARAQIASAKGKLQAGSKDNADAALAKAEDAAAAAARKQAAVADKTDKADKAPDAKAKKEQAAAAASDQVKLTEDIKKMQAAIDGLAKAGDAGQLKPDQNKHVQDAKKELNKARLEAKVKNAAILLAAGDTKGAKAEQEKIRKGIDDVADKLRSAAAASATDAATAMKKAKEDAAAANKNLEQLAGQKGAEKKETAQKTAARIERLARALSIRDMTGDNKQAQTDANAVKEAAKDPSLADKLEAKPAEADKLKSITERLTNHLEAAYQAELKSKELFAAQREECPPAYRPLVNKYFEVIGTEK